MIVYFILLLMIISWSAIIKYIHMPVKLRENLLIYGIAIMVFLLFALRNPSMGWDLQYGKEYGYLDSFYQLNTKSWLEIFATTKYLNYEYGYILLNKLIGSIYLNQQFFLAICAALSIFPIFSTIKKYSDCSLFSILIWFGLPCFIIVFSGLRQAIAISFCFYSARFIFEKKPIKFLIVVLLASCFHSSALLALICYPFYYIKNNNIVKVLSLLFIAIVLLFKNLFYNILSIVFGFEAIAVKTGHGTMFYVYLLIYVFCILYADKNNKMQNGCGNIFYLSLLAQVFGTLHPAAGRIAYYFNMYAILFIPSIFLSIKKSDKSLFMQLVEKSAILAFVIFAFYQLYFTSWAMAVPYQFFWE